MKNKKPHSDKPDMQSRAPRLAAWILDRLFSEPENQSSSGDFHEVFTEIEAKRGSFAARSWYWLQTLLSVVSFVRGNILWRCIMFQSYLKLMFRNFKKQKAYSFINVFGLTVGLACFILILIWVQHQRCYDTFHHHFDEIYRVNKIWRKGEIAHYATTPAPLADALKDKYPDIVMSTRIINFTRALFKIEEKVFRVSNGLIADTSFTRIFTFPFLAGDPNTALSSPNSIVLTESLSERLFGSEEPMGKTITVAGQPDIMVQGVIKDVPANSHLQFEFLLPYMAMDEIVRSDWHNSMFYTYLLLNETTDFRVVGEKISDYMRTPIPESTSSLYLQPLKKIHLHSSDLRLAMPNAGNMLYVVIFTFIAIFILAIAVINFVNLTTARSGNRAKEVGLRKVVGAKKAHLIGQFLGESLLITIFAFVFAVMLVYLFLPALSNMTGEELTMNLSEHPSLFFIVFGITLVTGILSGIYPAFILSSLETVKVIREKNTIGGKKSGFRKGLVVFQFCITITLIICTVIIRKQLHYLHNRELGFDKEYLISIATSQAIRNQYESFKSEILQNPSIVDVTGARSQPTWGHDITTEDVSWPGKDPEEHLLMRGVGIDYGYIETFGMEIVAGRNFSKTYATDTSNYIINEKAVHAMRLDAPVGTRFTLWEETGTIIGVVKDFHFKSLHNPIEPLLMRLYEPRWLSVLFIRINPEHIPDTIQFIDNKWRKFSPNVPFEYNFVDQLLENQYTTDQRINRIIQYFTILSILIACLGVFGLASYMAEKRTKEIGIRKVLGSSVSGIVLLISKEFTILVGISSMIAWPIGYFVMHKLLQNYAYRTHLNIWIFMLSGLAALIITFMTVSTQSIKAATANPINSLKYE